MRYLVLIFCLALQGLAVFAAERQYFVVVASFASEAAANKAADAADQAVTVRAATDAGGETIWRLVTGPFGSYSDADRQKQTLKQAGIDAPWISGEDIEPALPKAQTTAAPVVQAAPEVTSRQAPVVKDMLDQPALHRREIPPDLNRGVLPRVSARLRQRSEETVGNHPVLPAMERPSSNRISQLQRIQIRDIRVRGSNLLAADLGSLFAPYRGRTVSTEELLELKNQANQLFVVNGYINSGVVLPDQRVEDGVVYLDVIEGVVAGVDVTGNLRESYVSKRLNTNSPFNLKDLQSSLKLLEKNPLVERIQARILPGDELGTARVDITVDTPKFFTIGLQAANNRSPSVGAEYAELYFKAENLTGFGDSLRLVGAGTEGMDGYQVNYSLPFNARDHRLVFSYSKSDSTTIEEPFNTIDIDSVTESTKLGFIFPLRRTLNSEFAVEIHAERRRNFTTLLGQSFSFSEGAINGESRVAPIRVGASYVHQGQAQSFAGRIVVSRGTSGYNATKQATGPDGEFTSALAQLQYSRQLGERFHMTAKALAQYAADPLLAIERVALGGMDTVRGYRQNQLVRDNVYLATVEGRYQLPMESFRLQLVAFADWGSGKNHNESVSARRDSLSSAGVGLTVRGLKGLSADVFFANGFKDVKVRKKDPQDNGIHIKLNYEVRF